MNNITLYNDDCLDKLKELETNSVHAVVTDSPYGIAFMGEEWDSMDNKQYQEFCEEWATECKRVLIEGGYLLAFSSNRTHHRLFAGVEDAGFNIKDTLTWLYGEGIPKGSDLSDTIERYSDIDGSGWKGWRNNLKPASEYIVKAQNPIQGSIYKNCLENDVGALNIDECRVESDGEHKKNHPDERGDSKIGFKSGGESTIHDGRYPSNLLLSGSAIDIIDEQGNGASRYFKQFPNPNFLYHPKASSKERTHNGRIDNTHKTVKPVEVMEWLVKLVTKEDHVVLDPFMGSGSTGLACWNLNRKFIGIEKEKEFYDIAEKRIQDNIENADN